MRADRRLVWLTVWLLALPAAAVAKDEAAVDVRGFGWFGNREMERTLELLLDDGERGATVDAGFVEDAALVLNSELIERGFPAATVRVRWVDSAGRRGAATLDSRLSEPLPRPLEMRRVWLRAEPGMRAVVDDVSIEGLTDIPLEDARRYFLPDAGLYTTAAARAWSEAGMRRSAERLREALRALGREEAEVRATAAAPDPRTGAVRVSVSVREGPRWRVVAWRAEVAEGASWLGDPSPRLVGEPWTRALAIDLAQATRQLYYDNGYAEARVRWRAEPDATVGADGERAVTAVAEVEPGPVWTIGAVRFVGAVKTRESTMAVRVRDLTTGAPYDPVDIDAARLRLARLGVFRTVEAEGEGPDGGGERDVVFRVAEEARWTASWLIGYGSYEQARGVVELSRSNLGGLAHRDRVELAQSMKASRGEYRYTVPTLFNDTVEGSARVFGLRREEPSFVRVEYGAGVEAGREVPWIDARGTAGATYEVLRADNVELGVDTAEQDRTSVSALTAGLTRDVRDNPIRPRRGYRWSVQTETALTELGGEARYERVELAWSWHRGFGGGGAERWVHAGVSHGFVSGGGDNVPLNKLFFPGGESSIRGYPEGEATQRDAAGLFVGVRSVWLANLELEQLVTGRWTVVAFVDVLGTARNFSDWPGDETLASAGAGLRYQSPIGPLRIEYGRNLNRREGDPEGTLHFSIGFPF